MDKGQNLSVSTLVLVALGVLILVLAALAINKYWGGFSSTAQDCHNQGGTCTPSAQCANSQVDQLATCPTKGDVCCVGTSP